MVRVKFFGNGAALSSFGNLSPCGKVRVKFRGVTASMFSTDVSILRVEQGTEVCSMAGGLQAISAYFAPSKDLINHPI
mgnify:CR=1 FL=1